MVGRAKRASGDQCRAVAGEAGDAVDTRGLNGLGEGHGRQDGGETACEQLARFVPLALLLPQQGQAHGGAQLPGFGLLMTGNGEGWLEAGFGLGRIGGGPAQHPKEVAAPLLLPGAA